MLSTLNPSRPTPSTARTRQRLAGEPARPRAPHYADWLAASGGDSGSAYLYGTFDFDNGVQAWTRCPRPGAWATGPTTRPTLGPFHDTGSDRDLYAIRQLTRFESGGWKNLANTTKELSWDLSAGLKGRLADRFDWELAVGRARYTVDEYVRTVDTQKATAYFLGPQLGSTADGTPTIWTSRTGAQYNDLAVKAHNRADSWVNQASANITGELLQGWAGPIKFAAVGEVAKQGYRLSPDPCANTCYPLDVVDYGGGERLRYSGSWRPAPTARPGCGDRAPPAGLEWRPLSTLLLRGSVATSFRAPDMHCPPSNGDPRKNLRDQKIRSKLRGSVHWENGGPLDLTVYAKRFGSTQAVNWGTCTRFDDGYQPSTSDACRVTDPGNRHVGESTTRYFGRVGPALYWNLTAGYRITPKMKVNLYVNNVLDTVGYDNKERYYGYQFYNTTLYDAIGREVAAEYVLDF
ncbi:TonB-dependent receptor [Pantoea ananatis]|uniref:TonB-dependent receptor n=1 Tax=Pantoea ananas TaxID=553 RepID=UPI00221EB656|nr:TonB-dependent receptor [Pantoea ananatis]